MKKTTKKTAEPVKKHKSKKTSLKKSVDIKSADTSKPVKTSLKPKINYVFAVGRRKSSVARVRYYKKDNGEITINNKNYKEYFPYFEWQKIILAPIKLLNIDSQGKFTVKVTGGGVKSQAESIKLGISRILLSLDSKSRPILKSKKLLTRDPRVKERKKYGLKKARRAPQWQKR